MSTTMEGNRLIALFDGYSETGKFHPFDKSLGMTLKHPDKAGVTWDAKLQYHTSWDWLMPACHKWDNLDVSNLSADDREAYIFMCELLDNCIILYEIEPVYEQLIDCLKWYYVTNTSNRPDGE